jgi:2-polyprenyl-3-methyl-5-hydroxy-6-metoxy-1,4-benzoquinol methylase
MSFFPFELATPASPPGPVVEWEETNCLLCNGRRWFTLLEAPDCTAGGSGLWFAVVQCQDCGLCFTNPRPTPASLEQFYPTEYRPHKLRPRTRDSSWRSRLLMLRGLRQRDTIGWHGEGRLLDFGCGGGAYLDRMHRRGWRVTGLDTSVNAVEAVRKRLGLPALIGTLPHPELRPASFDVITMRHSLEHVHSPLEVLRSARRLLAPGGKLVVAVPNIDSLAFRWFGHAWFGLDLPRHLTHFTPLTLQVMLQRVGFRVGRVRMVGHSSWLRSSAKLACRSPLRSRWHHFLTGKLASRLATAYSFWTYQADCMAVTAWR